MRTPQPKPIRETVTVQVQQILPIDPEAYQNISKQQRAYWRNKAVPMPSARPKMADINSEEKLIMWLLENYGPGEYTLCFWDMYRKNKSFNPQATCNTPTCRYFQGKLSNRKKKIKRVRNSRRYCYFHRRIIPNWQAKCRIIITLNPDGGITYKIPRDRNKMYQFRWWKGKEAKGEVIPSQDDYY